MPGKALRGYHKLEQAEAAAACSANVDRPARARTSSHHHVTSLGVVDEDESDSDATDDKSCDDVINFDDDDEEVSEEEVDSFSGISSNEIGL